MEPDRPWHVHPTVYFLHIRHIALSLPQEKVVRPLKNIIVSIILLFKKYRPSLK
jgi:hypothetical protein